MNLNVKTQLQKDIEDLQAGIDRSTELVDQTVDSLNTTHRNLWNLDDDRLQALLQHLSDEGQLEDLLNTHASAAEDLNFLAEHAGVNKIAIIGRGREFTIADDGTVTLEPLIFDSPPLDSPA
jgi:hypothetical protein